MMFDYMLQVLTAKAFIAAQRDCELAKSRAEESHRLTVQGADQKKDLFSGSVSNSRWGSMENLIHSMLELWSTAQHHVPDREPRCNKSN